MSDFNQHYKELEEEVIHLKNELEACKKREQEVRDQETIFRLFYENSSDALLITSPDGSIHSVNKAGCDLFGWTEEEIYKGGRDLLVDSSQESLKKALQKRKEEGYVEGELIFVKKGGIKFIGEYTSNVFTNSEGLKRTSMIIRDVTKRKEAERIIKESEKKLCELNNTKDKLFSIIAHDIRGPFNNLKSLSELILKQLRNNEIAKAKEYATLISSSTRSGIILLENLLNWSQSQTGQLSFDPKKIDINEVMLNVIELKKPLWHSKEIIIDFIPKDGISAHADENMLRLILRNLISNAVKFTHRGGNITINATPNEHFIKVSVSDNGVGMNKEKLESLFDISKINSTAGTDKEKGSGLGLLICKEFVDRNGGEIWAESTEGNGTEFSFTLPMYNHD